MFFQLLTPTVVHRRGEAEVLEPDRPTPTVWMCPTQVPPLGDAITRAYGIWCSSPCLQTNINIREGKNTVSEVTT